MQNVEHLRPPALHVPDDTSVRLDCNCNDVRRVYPLMRSRAAAWKSHASAVTERQAHVRCHDALARRAAPNRPPPANDGHDANIGCLTWVRVRIERCLCPLS